MADEREREIPVSSFRVELECECGGSVERVGGIVYDTNPPQYPHTCQTCGKGEHVLGKSYPYIRHKSDPAVVSCACGHSVFSHNTGPCTGFHGDRPCRCPHFFHSPERSA